ncbi:migration and invasion enhancer 1-like [Rhinoraja longicauda]
MTATRQIIKFADDTTVVGLIRDNDQIAYREDVTQCFLARFLFLATEIKEQVPEAHITGFIGQKGSFEITINNKLVFSKLQTNSFPYHEDIIAAVKAVRDGLDEKIITVEEMVIKKKTCTVL